jgi:nicotinate-nucleotide adenylyltransferase
MGHLICAQEAFDQLDLDAVVFVPVGEAPHRVIEQDPGAEARLTMCEYAVGADARFGVSRIEVDRPGLSYTVDTLRAIREKHPDDELFFLMGGDQASSLPAWHEPREVLGLCTVAVVERAEHRRAEIAERVRSICGDDRAVFFDMPRVDVSSTLVRDRVAAGRPIRYLVPDKVANYIGAQSLYSASSPSPAGVGS